MLGTSRKDLLLAPVRDVLKRLTMNETQKGLLLGPFACDQIGCVVRDILPERRMSVPLSGLQSADHGLKLIFKFLLFARDDMVVHSDGDHVPCPRFVTMS